MMMNGGVAEMRLGITSVTAGGLSNGPQSMEDSGVNGDWNQVTTGILLRHGADMNLLNSATAMLLMGANRVRRDSVQLNRKPGMVVGLVINRPKQKR